MNTETFTLLSLVTLKNVLEYSGMVLSILGAELVSRKWQISPWGWLLWLGANVAFFAFNVMNQHWGQAATQAWFFKTSFAGVRNHLWPMLAARKCVAQITE